MNPPSHTIDSMKKSTRQGTRAGPRHPSGISTTPSGNVIVPAANRAIAVSILPSSCVRRTLGFTCRARLNDWPPAKGRGHTSAPCPVQAVVGRPGDRCDGRCRLDLIRTKRERLAMTTPLMRRTLAAQVLEKNHILTLRARLPVALHSVAFRRSTRSRPSHKRTTQPEPRRPPVAPPRAPWLA